MFANPVRRFQRMDFEECSLRQRRTWHNHAVGDGTCDGGGPKNGEQITSNRTTQRVLLSSAGTSSCWPQIGLKHVIVAPLWLREAVFRVLHFGQGKEIIM